MALNKLKKWIGTQAMTAFFDQLNDNVDATNAAIDLAEQNSANLSLVDIASDFDTISSISNVVAYKYGRLVFLRFLFKPTATGFNTDVVTTSKHRPMAVTAVTVATQESTPDSARGITAHIKVTGGVTAVVPAVPNGPMIFSCVYITT